MTLDDEIDTTMEDTSQEVVLNDSADSADPVTAYIVSAGADLLKKLSDNSVIHTLTRDDPLPHPTIYNLEVTRPRRYGVGSTFIGILIDTGAAKYSTAS